MMMLKYGVSNIKETYFVDIGEAGVFWMSHMPLKYRAVLGTFDGTFNRLYGLRSFCTESKISSPKQLSPIFM
jgi:hypothetical protein